MDADLKEPTKLLPLELSAEDRLKLEALAKRQERSLVAQVRIMIRETYARQISQQSFLERESN